MNGMGQGHIDVEMNTSNEKYTNATDITIRPAVGLQKNAVGGMVKSGESGNVSIANQYIPSYSKARLVVSRSPMVQFAKNLDYLMTYSVICY